MTSNTTLAKPGPSWNVLTDSWLDVMDNNAEARTYAPLDALRRAGAIRCIYSASPLDYFSAHRFLLTVLYWKADSVGGVRPLRACLLAGNVPDVLLNEMESESSNFDVFAPAHPFLQDTALAHARKSDQKSVGSFFAEYATGTNIAHFHHGDDAKMRLCLNCVTRGLLRVVPWSQAGGSGLTTSVHGAPPIMAVAQGANLAITLGLNLVPVACEPGNAQWTGHFAPTNVDEMIAYLEALIWNPRRIHLLSTSHGGTCWGCGCDGVPVVGPIAFKKNENTKKRTDGKPFLWQDPAAFYSEDAPYATKKSMKEAYAAHSHDLDWLLSESNLYESQIVQANSEHQSWTLIIPCTDRAKTFDHRSIKLTGLSPDAISESIPFDVPIRFPVRMEGWSNPRPSRGKRIASYFVMTSDSILTVGDWAILMNAGFKEMNDTPAGFDILSSILWAIRDRFGLTPSRNAAWLTLKLMATVPSSVRRLKAEASYNPLHELPKKQISLSRTKKQAESIYPISLPNGRRLEANLRKAISRNLRKRPPEPVDWAGLCDELDQLLD